MRSFAGPFSSFFGCFCLGVYASQRAMVGLEPDPAIITAYTLLITAYPVRRGVNKWRAGEV